MRTVLVIALAVIATACIQRPAPVAPQQPPAPVALAPAPAKPAEIAKPEPPKNLVCEAFKGVNDKATCAPYLTRDEAHTAMITIGGQQLHCSYTLKGVECRDPIVIVQQPPPPTEDKKTEAKKPPAAAAKGPKK